VTPWRIARRPPLLGEHNTEIYHGQLGIDAQRIAAWEKEGII